VGPRPPGRATLRRGPFPDPGADTEYTLDFTFERAGNAPPEFVMTLEPGIEWMLFNSVTLRTAPLVVFPGVF
jgi:hypothetical protein